MNLKSKIKKIEKMLNTKQNFYVVREYKDYFIVNGIDKKFSPKEFEEWKNKLGKKDTIIYIIPVGMLPECYKE